MSSYLSDLFSLEGMTALVAGGAGAIGSAVAEGYACAGATVIVHDLSQDRIDLLGRALPKRGWRSTVCKPICPVPRRRMI